MLSLRLGAIPNNQMFKCSKTINDEEVSLQCSESLNIFYFHRMFKCSKSSLRKTDYKIL
jgi:hypothetical protein